MTRVFSGVQPTGQLHLGNYLGAIRNFVTMGQQHECLYCVVDMHAITVWQDPADLRAAIRSVAAAFIACGVNPEQSIIFNQSRVSAHAELAWVLNSVARIGWLNRMTQFKEKAGKNKENASVGLYIYPVLMAADILAYRATHVPVGDDQRQHLELARDIAAKFNHDYGVDFFPAPEAVMMAEGTRVMSLRDGSAKMSKSDPSDYSRILLNDSADEIKQKVQKAKTDPLPLPETEADLPDRPEARNLLTIFAAVTGQGVDQAVAAWAGKQFSEFKPALTDALVAHLSPIRAEYNRLMDDVSHIDAVLGRGGERAAAIARPTIEQVYKIIGFGG